MKKTIKLIVTIVIMIFLIISLNCSLQSGVPGGKSSPNKDIRKIAAELEIRIPILMNEIGVPGLSIALIRNNDIVWNSAFGIINVDSGKPVDENTIFEAASLSKPVFAYLVLKFITRGELDLDTPLINYASEDYIKTRFLGKDFIDDRFKKITARMVLNHSTGFPNWREGNAIDFKYEPGSKFSYSAEAFYFLQTIIEKISDKKLTELMMQEIFEPLGMRKSSYTWQPEFGHNSAYRHDLMSESRGLRKHKRALGPATLQTTACDYACFLKALMNGEALDEPTYREMLRFQSTYSKEGFEHVDWGLGTGLEKSDGRIGIWHWGDNIYAQAFYLAIPDQKIGVVYFANSFYGLALAKDITEIALGGGHSVMGCGIMQPYISLGKPIATFIQKIKNQDFESAEDFFRKNIVHQIGHEYVYNESLLNESGYWVLKREQIDGAIRIFRLNVEAFPESWNVYDSLGEAYMKSGQNDQALITFKKSLELNPNNENAKNMIKRIKEVENGQE